jgi:hypothetical protein
VRKTRRKADAPSSEGRCQSQCVVATIAGSIDTSHPVSTTAASAAHRHFDAESSRGASRRPQIASDEYNMKNHDVGMLNGTRPPMRWPSCVVYEYDPNG